MSYCSMLFGERIQAGMGLPTSAVVQHLNQGNSEASLDAVVHDHSPDPSGAVYEAETVNRSLSNEKFVPVTIHGSGLGCSCASEFDVHASDSRTNASRYFMAEGV